MEINKAEYVGSFVSEASCPEGQLPEYAFIGRSNVGKSSLINMLCGQKKLAHTSQNPGKTQTINYFKIDDRWFIVDLPGYGYAKVSQKTRKKWEEMVKGYLKKRAELLCTFLLIDANVPPQESDQEFMNWLGEKRLPFVIVFTKVDRLKPAILAENIKKAQDSWLENWNELPQQFVTSAEKNQGKEAILQFIEQINQQAFRML